MKYIDLNSDMGEIREAVFNGTQESLMRSLTSVNIACGAHAGDRAMMKATIEQAARHGLSVGAHPGYPDRANFGRLEMAMTPEAIASSVFEQVHTLAQIAEECGVHVVHVKPHGALYNKAANDRAIACAIADGVGRWSRNVTLVGLAGSLMLDAFRQAGFPAAAEAFADRRYEADGSLRSREFEDALIREPAQAAQRALKIAETGRVTARDGAKIQIAAQTICIHGDTPDAPEIAAAVAETLRNAGIELRALAH
ncbi:MAG TPA: 5-oxoprolinase subunit PxpA [Candidatus Aquilonibacter sp.]|nr:5-oxoprolinase subunit PxpA [Candidatus Aquilonibacter sp.]